MALTIGVGAATLPFGASARDGGDSRLGARLQRQQRRRGEARQHGGNGGNGGLFTIVHDVGNAEADASNLVIVHDITTGDATASDVNVDAAGATRPVVVSVAGSCIDTSVDIFAPGGSSQAGTTGGNGIISDSSGGPAATAATPAPTAGTAAMSTIRFLELLG